MSNVDLGTHILTRNATPSFAFLIDNRKCIGCHACTTACKSENAVPLGVNRTWVKYTEKGTFPHTRRYFQVTRCNHCANPPCVTICPTRAMFQVPDGISNSMERAALAAKRACRPVRTTPSTSIRTRIPRRNVTSARTAPTSGWSRPAWSSAPCTP